jgi:ATP-binding cassette subfamily B multidrug efflux pump
MIDEVSFENVSFGYDPDVPVLKNITFTLKRNMKLAIVGPTGAGKSTIINLLARFYDPDEGVILIDGHNIRDIALDSLRSHMGIVLQDSFLFPISIRENIRFAKPNASDQEIVDAAKSVGAHDFIMKLPNDYDYEIQESSSNISIGQRQLISFARSLVANPEILVLDEATSSVDAYTELVIQNALKNLMRNRMTIIIAHRLSTVRLCDEILTIDHGSIVERGTHEELMRKKGLYSSFNKLQFREETGADVP